MNEGDLTDAALAGRLSTTRLGRRFERLISCGSTSDIAASRAKEGAAEGLVVATEEQTAGRGRLGRSWHAAPGDSLTFSLLLRPALPAWHVPPLTLLAGAVLAGVLAQIGVVPRLKWPNDVLLMTPAGPRKLAGILTEMSTEREGVRHVVLGMGINVNATAFPDELADRATSLRLALGRRVDRAALLGNFLNALEPAYDGFVNAGAARAIALWRSHALLGNRCRVDRLDGVAVDVDDDGALLLRDDVGTIHRVVSGEITDDREVHT